MARQRQILGQAWVDDRRTISNRARQRVKGNTGIKQKAGKARQARQGKARQQGKKARQGKQGKARQGYNN